MSRTALSALPPDNAGILAQLRNLCQQRGDEVAAWLEARRKETGAPFYASVDLRHSGVKLTPVDTNLFPAGFNQLSAHARARATEAMRAPLAAANAARVLVIPENHTRNTGYIDNLAALLQILRATGREVQLGNLAAQEEPVIVTGSDGATLEQQPLRREGSRLRTRDGFEPQLILLNNDLTSGLPEILRGVAQPIVPWPSQGWHRRRKSIHFAAYDRLAREFAAAFGLDPWLIAAEFHRCGRVDFGERQGLECIAMGVEKVLHKVRSKYAEYGINDTPYVFIKSDAGTYGMGIMTVRSGEEVYALNKKLRNKMDVIKEGVHSTEVIIQEGVHTIDRIEGAPAEPMLYLVDGHAIGGAFRVNEQRDATNNLNAAGMRFHGMCDTDEGGEVAMPSCRFGALGMVAALAALAAPREEYGEGYSI